MSRLDASPKVMALARDLGLPWRTRPLDRIRQHALTVVAECLRRIPGISTLEGLRSALAAQLSVCLEVVREDADLDRIAADYGLSEAERRNLQREFSEEDVEGWLISNPRWHAGARQYVAIVDGRGDRERRAYFTAWHELTHLIVTPPQLSFDGVGFRRSIPVNKAKDPVESVVDAIAGEMAFYEPFVRPVVDEHLSRLGRVTFEAVELIRTQVAPEASFYSTAIAVVRLAAVPTLLVQVQPAYKKRERMALAGIQGELGLSSPQVVIEPKLRVVGVGGQAPDLRIFKNMRVPDTSVLARAHELVGDVTLFADEDQDWWETSTDGCLPSQPISVEASRRGGYVYGLITPV